MKSPIIFVFSIPVFGFIEVFNDMIIDHGILTIKINPSADDGRRHACRDVSLWTCQFAHRPSSAAVCTAEPQPLTNVVPGETDSDTDSRLNSRVAIHPGLSGMSRICALMSRVPARLDPEIDQVDRLIRSSVFQVKLADSAL